MKNKKKIWECPRELRDTLEEPEPTRKGARETALAHRDTVLNQEIKLPALADLFRVTLSTINDGVIACDPKGIVTLLNPAAQTLTGWSEKEACGKSLETIFPLVNENNHQPADILDILSFDQDETADFLNQKILLAKDGTTRPIE